MMQIDMHYFITLVYIFFGAVFLFLGFYTFLPDPKSPERRNYLITVCILSLWSLFYGMMLVSGSEVTAAFFWGFGFIAFSLFFPSWIYFLAHITGFGQKNKLWLYAIYAISLAIAVAAILTGEVAFERTGFGFVFIFGRLPIFRIMAVYFIFISIIMTYLHVHWVRVVKTRYEKMSLTRFTVITFMITPPALFFEFVGPAYFDMHFIPIAPLLVSFVSVHLAYVMRTYSSMSISVKNVSEDIFKSIQMPILLLDNENLVIHRNSAAVNIWPDDSFTKDAAGLFLIGGKPPDLTFFDNNFTDQTVTVQTASGTRRYDSLLRILENKHGLTYCKIMAFKDITELVMSVREAEEASKAKSDFLSRMSHEMRTPMNAIIGMANVGIHAEDLERSKYCLKKIDDASRHLLSLINDVLDMSKIEANKLEIKENQFLLDDLIARVQSIVTIKAEEKNHNLAINIDKSIPQRLIGDDLLLSQVIVNFLSNAIKFTDEGGNIILNMILLSHDENNVTIRIEVIDDGIGIDSEHHNRLFSSFEQVDGEISRKFGGTGLGLSISKDIIKLMGGNIGVESEEGKGSCFHITVPLRCDDKQIESYDLIQTGESNSPEASQYISNAFEGNVVLLVEDIEINREIVTSMLDETGLIFDHAQNGEIAVEMFKNAPDKYDLIFMDIQMPIMDGLEATRQIRQIGTDKAIKIPIIAMTANAFDEDVQRCVKAGMNDHISKPIDYDDVISKLFSYLNNALNKPF